MKRLNKLLIICLLTVFLLPTGLTAAEINSDPALMGDYSTSGGLSYNSPFTGLAYTVPSPVVSLGIDVSAWQEEIDWQKVAESGVKFAIIRVAHHNGYNNVIEEDKYFRQNIEGARAAGIKVGVYIFSQAITEKEARQEANYVMTRIAPYTIDLPIVLDFEYEGLKNGSRGRLYKAYEEDHALNTQKATDICLAFCDQVSENGYSPMVYASAWIFRDRLNTAQIEAVADIWLANYAQKTSYTGNFQYWQYSSSGRVNGIKGNVDCDFAFVSKTYQSGHGCFPFLDVPKGSWYYDAAVYTYKNGIFVGTDWDTFAPNMAMTRGMLVSVLYRIAGSPAVSGETPFSDLTADWYKAAVNWGYQNGIIYGVSDTLYAPDDKITREQLACMLCRYAEFCGEDVTSDRDISAFADSDSVSDFARGSLSWAVEKGLICGYPGNLLGPLDGATRSQVASVLYRYLEG